MKRLLSLILIFALGLNLCMFTYAEDQNANISNFKEEKEFLKLLDISGSSVLDKAEIARGEFVAYTVNLLYPDNIFDSKEAGADILFSDVDATHSFYDEIRAAKSLGIISGTADMSFKPDENITFNDAVVVMVNALGYSYYAQANGGYPAGYLFAASQIALTKGVANVSGNIDGNIMAKLIYNALFVDEIEYGGVSNGGLNLVIKPDSNLLSSKYDIYKYDAQVVRTFISSIDGEGAMNDETVSNFYLDCEFENGAFAQIALVPMGGVVAERVTVNTHDETFMLELPFWGNPDAPGRLRVIKNREIIHDISGLDLSDSEEMFETSGFYDENRMFFELIRSGAEPTCDLESGVQSVEIANCLRQRKAQYVKGE